jgi:5S rRNA maturation endonuclease (ribonuclease M5)
MILPNFLENIWSVSSDSIKIFGPRWCESKKCYLFPMWDGIDNLIGIQERYLTGEKKATAGSKLGLFIPTFNFRQTKGLIITEGVSDAIVLSNSCRLPIIARPSCSTGTSHIRDFLNVHTNIKTVVIIADNDEVGIRGAQDLRDVLKDNIKYLNLTVLAPFRGSKDVRELRNNNPTYYENFFALVKMCAIL